MPQTAAQPVPRNGRAAPAPTEVMIPFAAAAHEHTEPAFDVTVTPGAATVALAGSPFDVPAFGYLRHLVLEVTASGGTLGAGVLSADYPFNVFETIQLADVNGAPIYGPLDGYATLWANIVGGYAGRPDPRALSTYVATINTTFKLRIPVEISHRDGFGSIGNQNSASNYKVTIRINPSTTLYSTAPTTIPAFRIRGRLETWTLPNERSVDGRPQMQLPPVHGTTQYWSHNTQAVAVGQQTVPIVRVGNLIRNIVIIARNAAGARADGVFPDPATLSWDARQLRESDTQNYMVDNLTEGLPDLTARDAGVFAYSFDRADHNQAGDDSPTFWLPTVQSSRLELDGIVAMAGNLTIMVNDVAPAEVTPSERYVETSRTGFQPQVAAAPYGAR